MGQVMSVADCAILRNAWAHEISVRNGAAAGQVKVAGRPTGDAGSWEPTVQRIVGFQHLADDWDGFGATAPLHEVLQSAIGLAYCFFEQGVDPPHRVTASVGGEVVFEWQDADGTYTEVEIEGPLQAAVMVAEPGKPAKQWTLPTQ
jgi:hypothetical protein